MWSVNHGHTVTPGERVVRRGKVITSLPEEQFDMNMKERLVDILDKLKLALILLAGGVSIIAVVIITGWLFYLLYVTPEETTTPILIVFFSIITIGIISYYTIRYIKNRRRDRKLREVWNYSVDQVCTALLDPKMQGYTEALLNQLQGQSAKNWTIKACLLSLFYRPEFNYSNTYFSKHHTLEEVSRQLQDDDLEVITKLIAKWDSSTSLDFRVCLAAQQMSADQRKRIAQILLNKIDSCDGINSSNVLEAMVYIDRTAALSLLANVFQKVKEAAIEGKLTLWSSDEKRKPFVSALRGMTAFFWACAEMRQWSVIHDFANLLKFETLLKVSSELFHSSDAPEEFYLFRRMWIALCMSRYSQAIEDTLKGFTQNMMVTRSKLGVYHGPNTLLDSHYYESAASGIRHCHDILSQAFSKLKKQGVASQNDIDSFLLEVRRVMSYKFNGNDLDVISQYISILSSGSIIKTVSSNIRDYDYFRP